MSRTELKGFLDFKPDSNNATGFLSFLNSYFEKELIIIASSAESCCSQYNIFKDSGYWRSEDTPNPSISFSFPKYLFKMNSFSAYSCKTNECFNDLDVYGSVSNSNPELICSFRGDYKLFYQKNTKIDCSANKLYSNITVVSPSLNSYNQIYIFSVLYSTQ